ncbi:hypothetical protein NQZ68_005494 [Dissostichus eleginoides]|nr:hypothetical protein NQZ68_005494 [Dissostichus eleginoides]
MQLAPGGFMHRLFMQKSHLTGSRTEKFQALRFSHEIIAYSRPSPTALSFYPTVALFSTLESCCRYSAVLCEMADEWHEFYTRNVKNGNGGDGAPTAARAPPTTTITAVLPKNKRESVRHHPLDLFHTRAPTSVPDGVAFFQGFSQPQESSKIEAPLPLDPTTQLPVIHLLRRHAPVARAPPLSIPPHQGVLLKSLTTLCWGLLPGHHSASRWVWPADSSCLLSCRGFVTSTIPFALSNHAIGLVTAQR